MILTIYTDGGSLNNPGPAACAYAIYRNTVLIDSLGRTIGVATNNVAEYTGLIGALEKIISLKQSNKLIGLTKICIYADSELMINQLNGLYKIKKPHLRELFFKIRGLETKINIPIIYKHIPREQNQLTDSLVKKSLNHP